MDELESPARTVSSASGFCVCMRTITPTNHAQTTHWRSVEIVGKNMSIGIEPLAHEKTVVASVMIAAQIAIFLRERRTVTIVMAVMMARTTKPIE